MSIIKLLSTQIPTVWLSPGLGTMGRFFGTSFAVSVGLSSPKKGYEPPEEWNESTQYTSLLSDKRKALQDRQNNPKRFQIITEREERSDLHPDSVKGIVSGKYRSVYRGIDMLKAPVDTAILYQMFWYIKPCTVIELGSFTGGSALWIVDTLNTSNIECNVFSVDIDLSNLDPMTRQHQPTNLTFFEGDNKEINKVLTPEFLHAQQHPLIVIDDAHIDFDVVMEYFDKFLIPGDYLVCEDTSPDMPDSLQGALDAAEGYTRVGLEKLMIWKTFLEKHGDKYAVDSFYSDFFGYNASSNWDGYVRRMK